MAVKLKFNNSLDTKIQLLYFYILTNCWLAVQSNEQLTQVEVENDVQNFCQNNNTFANFTTTKQKETIQWSQQLVIDNQVSLIFKWSRHDPDWLLIEFSAKVKGYIALEFCPIPLLEILNDTAMGENDFKKICDIILAWVDQFGKGHVRDLHRMEGEAKVEKDFDQNYELLQAQKIKLNRTDVTTTILIGRRWTNCDPQNDANFSKNSHHILGWTYADVQLDAQNFDKNLAQFELQGIKYFQFDKDEDAEEQEKEIFCTDTWLQFWQPYNELIHLYLKLTICAIGVVPNILNILVFTQKTMRNPTNLILTALALADLLFVSKELFRQIYVAYSNPTWRTSYWLVVETLVNDILFLLFHTFAIMITLLVAGWRFLGVLYPLQSRNYCTKRTAKWSILIAIIFSTILVSLTQIGVTILMVDTEETQAKEYRLNQTNGGDILQSVIKGFFIKLIPCVLLTFLSLGLIISLIRARRNRKTLKKSGSSYNREREREDNDKKSEVKGLELDRRSSREEPSKKLKEERDNRTNKMLLIVLIIFLLTEFPMGIISAIQIAQSSDEFHQQCIRPLLSILTVMEYLSSSTSFFIYLLMSHKFRSTLRQIFNNFFYSFINLTKWGPCHVTGCCKKHEPTVKSPKSRSSMTMESST